jgi:hypothetical protein
VDDNILVNVDDDDDTEEDGEWRRIPCYSTVQCVMLLLDVS